MLSRVPSTPTPAAGRGLPNAAGWIPLKPCSKSEPHGVLGEISVMHDSTPFAGTWLPDAVAGTGGVLTSRSWGSGKRDPGGPVSA